MTEAAHDIEWVDSGDYGEDGADDSIDKVFSFLKTDPKDNYKIAVP